jgi:Fe-S cluster assembly protein SufD
LEILSDDVICGHGSTVGPLDEEPLYYLTSRGLSEARAARLLVHGFFEEVINRLPHPALTEPIREAVNRKFVEAQQEGRV